MLATSVPVALPLACRQPLCLRHVPIAPRLPQGLAPQPGLKAPLLSRCRAVRAAPSDRRTAVTRAQAAQGSSEGGGRRHAALHDFCMAIPYGLLVAVGGVAGMVAGAGLQALGVALAGAFQVLLANVSLRTWRAGRPTTLITSTEAAVSGALAYGAWEALRGGAARVPMTALLALSSAMAAFLAYNLAAGGNPPRKSGGSGSGELHGEGNKGEVSGEGPDPEELAEARQLLGGSGT